MVCEYCIFVNVVLRLGAFMKAREFLDLLIGCELLKEDPAFKNYSIVK
jgi:hypothetical protein